MRLSPLVLLVAAAALAASAARAQTAAARLDLSLPDVAASAVPAAPVAKAPGVADKAIPDLANPLDPLARPTLAVNSMDSAVFATTAVEHSFAKSDDLTGSLGFLCGRQPGHTESGGAAAYGSDPHGRFVGAKLSLAF